MIRRTSIVFPDSSLNFTVPSQPFDRLLIAVVLEITTGAASSPQPILRVRDVEGNLLLASEVDQMNSSATQAVIFGSDIAGLAKLDVFQGCIPDRFRLRANDVLTITTGCVAGDNVRKLALVTEDEWVGDWTANDIRTGQRWDPAR